MKIVLQGWFSRSKWSKWGACCRLKWCTPNGSLLGWFPVPQKNGKSCSRHFVGSLHTTIFYITPWVSVLPPWLLVIYRSNPPERTVFIYATPPKNNRQEQYSTIFYLKYPKILIWPCMQNHIDLTYRPYVSILLQVPPRNPQGPRHLQRHLEAAARGPRHFGAVLGKHREHHLGGISGDGAATKMATLT